MNCSFSYQRKSFLLFYSESEKNILRTLTANYFHNFQNIFQTLDREQRKLLFTRFNSENILSSLALETGTMNNNLVINKTSIQLLLLGAEDFTSLTRYETLVRERIFFAYSTNPYQCFKRSEID